MPALDSAPPRIDTPAGDPVIILDRVVDAPRREVFAVYADPAHLVNFWGPHGGTTTISAFDFRVGGAWRMVIRFPAGFDVPMNSVFEEIDPPRRIAFRSDDDDAPHRMRVAIDFADEGERTRLIVTARFDGLAQRDEAVAHGFTGPIVDSFERLEALLAARD
jgi:uncharacterized protein YndB with AHSA1/START domain